MCQVIDGRISLLKECAFAVPVAIEHATTPVVVL